MNVTERWLTTVLAVNMLEIDRFIRWIYVQRAKHDAQKQATDVKL